MADEVRAMNPAIPAAGIERGQVSLRERIARAIEATMFAPHELPLSGDLHQKYLETADAALAAIEASGTHAVVPMEPTPEMLSAGDSMMPQIAPGEDITTGYDALVDAWPAMLAARPRQPDPAAPASDG
jgi:hypothetical protein